MQGIKISMSYVGARLDIALIRVFGYVDTTTCQELTKEIQDLVEQKHYQIIADLGGVTYISSAGWGVFVGEIKNIRDKGGDLKIVQMSPEVFEVFEMLEFNRILNYYDSIEESINEFDILRGIDITKVDDEAKQIALKSTTALKHQDASMTVKAQEKREEVYSSQKGITIKDLPLIEKVKMIVVGNPVFGARAICRQLSKDKYGSVRMGWLRMRSLLKRLDLETKEKRYRFYRSR